VVEQPLCVLDSSLIRSSDAIRFCCMSVNNISLLALVTCLCLDCVCDEQRALSHDMRK
jgi:hypothetical protein